MFIDLMLFTQIRKFAKELPYQQFLSSFCWIGFYAVLSKDTAQQATTKVMPDIFNYLSWKIKTACYKDTSMVQGISYWNVFYELTLTDKNMQAIFCLKVILTSWDYGIWVLATSFWRNDTFWPRQPLTEKNMQAIFCLKAILTSWDYGFCVSATSF